MKSLHSAQDIENFPASTVSAAAEVTYTPDSIRWQGWHTWGIMLRECLDSRELIWRLILRDISARYRQSVLGYLWAVLPPTVTVAVFAALAQSGTIPIGETPLPYVAYALWGISFWQFFAGCLSACTSSLTAAGSLVTKVNFPKEVLVIAAIGQPLLDFVIRFLLVLVVSLWYEIPFRPQIVFLPLVVFPAVLLATGFGFVFSIANLLLRDVGSIVGMGLTFAMFLAPVLYPPPTTWPSSLVNILNPFSPLLIASQDLIASGSLSMPRAFLLASLFATLVFLGGWRLFRLTLPRVSAYA
jgi:lipopolysaccharide transport system permease protein